MCIRDRGNSASFAQQARCVNIELNLGVPAAIEGLHDNYVPAGRPNREPMGLVSACLLYTSRCV